MYLLPRKKNKNGTGMIIVLLTPFKYPIILNIIIDVV